VAGPRKPAETGTEVKTSPVETDVAAAAGDAVEAAETVPAGDPRESALQALLYGKAEPLITPETEVEVDASNVIDFGGKSKAVVTSSRYNQFVGGLFKQARKGQVITTDADNLKRGIRLKALRKLEG
jgi:hypothetical protein